MKLSATQRHYVFAAVIVLVTVLLWADLVRRFNQVSVVPESVSADAFDPEVGNASAWRTYFEQVRPEQAQFVVIRDRNVFSPSRKAWVETVQDAPRSSSSADADIPAERGDFKLMGTARMGGNRKVILNSSSSGRGFTKFYGEGDSVIGSKGPMLRVVEIGEQFVKLEDSGGKKFTVGLFDHKREKNETINESIYMTPTLMVIVGDTDSDQGQNTSAEGQGVSVYVSKKEEETRNEQLVREGKLEKVETPFGPVFRKPG